MDNNIYVILAASILLVFDIVNIHPLTLLSFPYYY